jgi:hypothetical protein
MNSLKQTTEQNKMSKFNANAVAAFIASQSYVQFETQVRGKVATHFGITPITAARWVERVITTGLIKRNGRVALALV